MSNTQSRPDEPAKGNRLEPPRWLRQWWRRLYFRRWLVAVVTGLLLIYVAVSNLSLVEGMAGAVVVAIAAGALPRQGVLKRQRRHEPARQQTGDIVQAHQRLLEGLPEPGIILSRRGTVLAFNTHALESYPALARGEPVSTALRHPQLLDAIDNAVANRPHQIVALNEVVPVERWLSVTVSWIGSHGADANAPAVFLFMRDLTEQERIGQMRADFVANASHELKTPLASVLGFIETLRGPARDDARAREEFLGVMAHEAERMKRIINDLLSLSRVEMKAHLRPTDPVEINEILDYARNSLERVATARNITIELTPLPAPAYVLGERDGLIHAFENLVNNAIKYGHEGGTVRIVAKRERGKEPMLSVAVIDDGVGIPEEHLPRLTERFYRVNVADSRDRGGTGLGLSIVKHVLNRHRGHLRIASEPGKGSRFTVLLPESVRHRETPRNAAAEASGTLSESLPTDRENAYKSMRYTVIK